MQAHVHMWVKSLLNYITELESSEYLSCIVGLYPSGYYSVDLQASIVNNVNTSIGNTSVGEVEYTLYGKSTITEVLRGLVFQISANSFFQTNTYQVCFGKEQCPLFAYPGKKLKILQAFFLLVKPQSPSYLSL